MLHPLKKSLAWFSSGMGGLFSDSRGGFLLVFILSEALISLISLNPLSVYDPEGLEGVGAADVTG